LGQVPLSGQLAVRLKQKKRGPEVRRGCSRSRGGPGSGRDREVRIGERESCR